MDNNDPVSAIAPPRPGTRASDGTGDALERPRRQALPFLGALAAAVAGVAMSCGDGSGANADLLGGSTEADGIKATLLDVRLNDPWGLAFLPDGRMLVTQRGGSFAIVKADGSAVDATVSGPVPAVATSGQGGLLDVVLDPAFGTNQTIYWTYSEPGTGGAGTAVARGRLNGSTLSDVAVIYRQTPKVSGGNHFGSRLAFRSDGTLYVTLGERAQDAPEAPTTANAQNLAKTLGKVIRINRDGSPAAGNPSLGAGALPEIWSYGHRNPQGAAVRPGTDELWLTEHGPRGGDELNVALAGKNYGWPLRSYGCPYGFAESDPACRPGGTGGVHAPDFEEPKTTWLPISTAPSGLLFYTGSRFPDWRGHVFAGALAGQTLWHVSVDGGSVAAAGKQAISAVSALGRRIRDVRQGPDGWIYLLSTDGRVIRVER